MVIAPLLVCPPSPDRRGACPPTHRVSSGGSFSAPERALPALLAYSRDGSSERPPHPETPWLGFVGCAALALRPSRHRDGRDRASAGWFWAASTSAQDQSRKSG